MSKYRAVVDISKLGRRYRSWCGATNRLDGSVQMLEFDLPHQCELWEVEGPDLVSAWRSLTGKLAGYPVTIYQIGPVFHPDLVWPRKSRCEYGHD